MVSVTTTDAATVVELCPWVEALEDVLDGPNVEVAWLVDPPVDDCVAVCVDELCPSVDGPDVEVAWLVGPPVELAWLVDPPVDDCVEDCVDELWACVEVGAREELLDGLVGKTVDEITI